MGAVNLPMACACGEDRRAKMDALLAHCTEVLNDSDDWLRVKAASIDLLMTAICYEGLTVQVFADQWFGLVADRDAETVVSVECDRLIDGLAAIYLHLRDPAPERRTEAQRAEGK